MTLKYLSPFLFLLLLPLGTLGEESTILLDCKLHISISQSHPSQMKLTLSHDENCTIIIEDANKTITIIPTETNNTLITPQTEHNLSLVEEMITLAKSKIKKPYKIATQGPDTFDCSGFIYFLFHHYDIALPRTSLAQSQFEKPLDRTQIKRGDILFFDTSLKGHINHSGLYLGEGRFIHSSSGKAYGVTISKLDKGFYLDKFRWGSRITKVP